jgi:hypothetical protein
MVVGILSTSNFKILSILVLFAIHCSSTEWYRKLPDQKEPDSNLPLGIWKKRVNPRMPMNSTFFQDKVKEEILLKLDNQFEKFYESELHKGENTYRIWMKGEGLYFTNGNWILFETKKVLIREYENNFLKKEKVVEKENRVLYYFWKKESLIIPMIYEKAFEEKNFGVKDGVTRPYDESEKNFYNYIRIYTYKEFQPHAYFFSGAK